MNNVVNRQKITRSIRGRSICSIVIVVGILFFLFFYFYMPLDFDNLGGKHAWVSGSTIKYANMWLEEGAANLHFTNIEFFPSIEFPNISDRLPYVSYPTGTTFMVWVAAKIAGYSHIDISFLKHFQLIMYAVENVLFSIVVYLCLARFLKIREVLKVLVSIALTCIWMTMPFNNWFLTNIYWTDIAVFLWIIAFILSEIVSEYIDQHSKAKVFLPIFKCIIIFFGILTEYYFWIVVFLAFLLNCVRVIAINYEEMSKKELQQKVVYESVEYVVPVILGLLVYLWQISYTDNWMGQLVNTFLHRTGANNNEASLTSLYNNYIKAVVCGSNIRGIMLLAIDVLVVVLTIITIIIKKTSLLELISSKLFAILFIMILSPIMQILLFSNHSAIHQYAFVKIGLHLMGILILVIWCTSRLSRKMLGYGAAVLVICAYLISLGYPSQIKGYYNDKNSIDDYSIAEIIYENTKYEDVCFSFTYSIQNNPPMDISVSEKAVYLIDNTDDIYNIFPEISSRANYLLVIDKKDIGSNDYVDRKKTDSVLAQEQYCMEIGNTRYSDDICAIIEMPNQLAR